MRDKQHKFTIGRGQNCDIVLADKSVSRRHAELTILEDGRLFLTDCRSTNGTALRTAGEWQEIRQELVSPTNDLRFGDVEITMRKLLETIQLIVLPANSAQSGHLMPAELLEAIQRRLFQSEEPWNSEATLIRCQCGAIKARGEACRICGR